MFEAPLQDTLALSEVSDDNSLSQKDVMLVELVVGSIGSTVMGGSKNLPQILMDNGGV